MNPEDHPFISCFLTYITFRRICGVFKLALVTEPIITTSIHVLCRLAWDFPRLCCACVVALWVNLNFKPMLPNCILYSNL
jgi:hypothetical protein